jgi:colanic acid/amylovoran biosynthesis protein
MKKVLIDFYSKNNLGDDLFVSILASRYKNTFSIITTQNTPLFKKIKNLKVHQIPYIIFLLFKVVERIKKQRNILFGRYLRKNDLVAHIGGSIFIEGDNLARWRGDRDFYTNLSKPYYILGSNVGPYKSNEFMEILRDTFIHAEDVCFRDKASYRLFQDLDTTRVSTDIVFTLDAEPYMTETKKQVVFSLIDSYRKFDSSTALKYEREVLSLTRKFIDEGYEIVYMSFCKHEGDEHAAERIIAKAPLTIRDKIEAYNYSGDMDGALTKIMQSEVVVATRFHAMILGLLFGKKVLPMAYSDKTIDMLNDIGFKGPAVDIRKTNDFNANKFDVNSFEKNDISKQIKTAELQFQELDKVLVKKK